MRSQILVVFGVVLESWLRLWGVRRIYLDSPKQLRPVWLTQPGDYRSSRFRTNAFCPEYIRFVLECQPHLHRCRLILWGLLTTDMIFLLYLLYIIPSRRGRAEWQPACMITKRAYGRLDNARTYLGEQQFFKDCTLVIFACCVLPSYFITCRDILRQGVVCYFHPIPSFFTSKTQIESHTIRTFSWCQISTDVEFSSFEALI